VLGCSSHPSGGDAGTTPSPGPPRTEAGAEEVLVDFAALPSGCDLAHRGLFVDLGDPADRTARVRGPKSVTSKYEAVEHERSTYARVTGTEITVPFLGPDEAWPKGTPLVLEPRLIGGGARSATLLINGRVAGRASLVRGQPKQLTLTTSDVEVLPGRNELTLRFPAQASKGNDVAAEVDWVHIGPPDDLGPYAAPTRALSTGGFKVDAELLRGLLLRAPGHARCVVPVSKGARLRARVGALGEGQAELRVVVSRDRTEPAVLATVKVATDSASPEGTATKATGVVPIDVEVPEGASLASLRFEVVSASKGVRVVLGEPRLIAPPRPPPAPHTSQAVVLVVFGGLPNRYFTREGVSANVELTALANGALILPNHRVASSLSGASLASMLTGTHDHGMAASCKLSPNVVTLPEALRDAGIRSAFFTANPWSTQAHQLNRGFSAYEAVLPGDGQSGEHVFELAQDFVQHHAKEKFFVVVHARGGHPPWDIGREILKELPPQNYPGGIDPKHAGELLAKARSIPPGVRFTDADRERMWAMHKVALEAESQALVRFHRSVTRSVENEDPKAAITWIVTGDVALDESGAVPFGDGEVLNEAALYPGMFVLAPGIAPSTSVAATESTMIAATVAQAFGLAPPESFARETLFTAAERPERAHLRYAELERKSIAELSHFAWVYAGGDPARFCDLSLEAQCLPATDVRFTDPVASYAVASLAQTFLGERKPPRCVPADLDPTMQTALHTWGRK
jgi:hypothetical protein